jgi:hypothetical protein
LSAAYHNVVRVLLAIVALSLVGGVARSAEVTRVVSALDDDNRFDVHLTLAWTHASKFAFIKRESETDTSSLVKDLIYRQTSDVLHMRADFGVLQDTSLFVEAPLVLGDARTLELDQSLGSACIYPGAPNPNCVNEQNSTILRDRILPGYQSTTYGINSPNGGGPFARPDTRVFAGPNRAGFEYLGFGVNWAIFNQARDDTKPTWMLGFESKLDIFHDMAFDPANPTANTAVGPGYHQFVLSTAVSKRFRHFDPYFGASYMLPVRTNGSLYQQYPGASWSSTNPQQIAGIVFGVEQIAWENPAASQRVTVELHGHAEEHLFGRSASELWEPLSGSSLCKAEPTGPGATFPNCRPGLDLVPGPQGAVPSPYPGVTQTQAYATFGGDVGLNIHVGKHARFRALGGLSLDMPHFITFGTADPNTPPGSCTAQRNCALIDQPGRRFRVEGTQIWSLLAEGSIMF